MEELNARFDAARSNPAKCILIEATLEDVAKCATNGGIEIARMAYVAGIQGERARAAASCQPRGPSCESKQYRADLKS
jgi:hypothetical protein